VLENCPGLELDGGDRRPCATSRCSFGRGRPAGAAPSYLIKAFRPKTRFRARGHIGPSYRVPSTGTNQNRVPQRYGAAVPESWSLSVPMRFAERLFDEAANSLRSAHVMPIGPHRNRLCELWR
jgi:hypothetical protein